MTKSRAYTTEFGFEKITAWSIMQERKNYDGKPLGKIYWSWRRPGRRKPVKHVMKGSTAFFAYMNSSDEASGDGGGESLTHELFKEALAGLSKTTLKLGSFGEHEVTISHGETEKEMPYESTSYYADAYWHFSSNTNLDFKWSGEMYLEVNHTHPVPVDKQEDLRQARYPVIEIKIPQGWEYKTSDEMTTDFLEQNYVQRIQDALQQGSLTAQVICNRRSVMYLEQQVRHLAQALDQTKNSLAEAEQTIAAASQQLHANALTESNLKSNVSQLKQQLNQHVIFSNGLTAKHAKEAKENLALAKALSDTNSELEEKQKDIRSLSWMFWGSAAAALLLGITTIYLMFFSKPKEIYIPVAAPPAAEPAPTTAKTKKPPKQPAQSR